MMWFLDGLGSVLCLVGLDLQIQIREWVSSSIKNFLPALFCSLSAVITAPSNVKDYEQKDNGLPVDIKLPVKHILSRELQVYDMLCAFSIYSLSHPAVC